MAELKEIVFNNKSETDAHITKIKLDDNGILAIDFGNPGDPSIVICRQSEKPYGRILIEDCTFEWPESL